MTSGRLTLIATASLVPIAGTIMLTVAAPPPQTVPAAAPPATRVDSRSCVTEECHVDVKAHRFVHGPVSVDACDACHELVDEVAHTFRRPRDGQALCLFCHEMQLEGAAIVHGPLVSGDCLECHDAHGGRDQNMLRAASANDLCKRCHEDVVGSSQEVHGPVAAGACAACHLPHASPYRKLLTAEGPELCTGCHVTTQNQLSTLRVLHAPVVDNCQSCHDAHASDYDMILLDEPKRLCLSCHEVIEHMVESATTQHAAVTTDRLCLNCHEPHASDYPRILLDEMTTLCFECHDREITLDDGRKLGNIKAVLDAGTSRHGPVAQNNCAACHEIHGGDEFRLLIQEYPAEFYAPFQEESYALCFSCHEKQILQDPRTTALTDFRNGDLNLHFLHVNREKKGRTCRACHETHASQKGKHIRESVPFGTGGWMLPIRFEKTGTGGSCAPGCHLPYGYDRENPVQYGAPDEQAAWSNQQAAAVVAGVGG
jgi:predicted CXXCH cytochrome family protein